MQSMGKITMISQEIINRMGVTRGTTTFSNDNGKISQRSKVGVVDGGAIGDESAGGSVSVRR